LGKSSFSILFKSFLFIMGLCFCECERKGYFNLISKHTKLNLCIQVVSLISVLVHVFRWTPDHQSFIAIFYSKIAWDTYSEWPKIGILNPIPFWYGPSLEISLMVFFLFILFELNKPLQWLFSTRFFQILGKMSFSLYLIHLRKSESTRFILACIKVLTPHLLEALYRVKRPNELQLFLLYITITLFTFTSVFIFYHTADAFSIWIGRYIYSFLMYGKDSPVKSKNPLKLWRIALTTKWCRFKEKIWPHHSTLAPKENNIILLNVPTQRSVVMDDEFESQIAPPRDS
jgi:hypothetical protein